MRVLAKSSSVRAASGRRTGLHADEVGATAIEYALIGALIAVFIITALQALSSSTGGLYGALESLANAIGAALGA
jgi:Flp pilus assembly pilin Flp